MIYNHVIIYGRADTEKRLLDKLPNKVESIDQIDRVHQKFRDEFNSIENKGLRNRFSRWNKKRQINKIKKIKILHYILAQKENYAF